MATEEADLTLEERVLLRATRYGLNHNQAAAMAALQSLGALRGDQTTLSNWERGQTRQPDQASLAAISRYCVSNPPAQEHLDRARLELADSSSRRARIRQPKATGPSALDEALVSATLRRLEVGPPMSEADERTIALLADLLRTRPHTKPPGAAAK